jgi:N-acetylglucosaminyl-diphospho-decaprenol L-rhamnosyltransferase
VTGSRGGDPARRSDATHAPPCAQASSLSTSLLGGPPLVRCAKIDLSERFRPESAASNHPLARVVRLGCVANLTFVVVVSLEAPDIIERCLEHLTATRRPVIVVDNVSSSQTASALDEVSGVTVVRLEENKGYGAAANVGIERSAPDDVLLLNADAWPTRDGFDQLLACQKANPEAGIVAPRLVGGDGTPQPSQFGFPTRWWSGRPALTSWPERARQGRRRGWSDPQQRRVVVGAALLLRRAALDEVGSFDPTFFVFNEEVDLAWRMWEAGWTVALCPDATFVHIGGSATRGNWPRLYREQVRGHLIFLAKYQGLDTAERARRHLTRMVQLRALFARGEGRVAYREAAAWLASGHAKSLLARQDATSAGRAGASDRSSGSDR